MELREQLQATLSGTYTLERELGGGGMSRVFVADEVRLGRKVVVKVLSPELAAGINAERFEREIRLAASLQQANIVPVLSAGETGGLPYYTMPYVDGESLRARIARAPLAVSDVVRILGDVARALAYAHEHGIVHRDIKPDNVLLSGGTAVVTDFGIAKALAAARGGIERPERGSAKDLFVSALTLMGTSIGTPAYMAPEQAAGDPNVDHRADVYAFGCMAYELLAGHPPFDGRTPQRVLAAHVNEMPVPIADQRPDAPPALCELVMRCLAKNADERPQSAGEILASLDAVSSNGVGAALPPVLLGGPRAFRKALLMYVGAVVVVAVLARAAIVGIGLPDWVFPGALIAMAIGLPAILFTGYAQRVAHRIVVATPTYTPGGTASVIAPGTMATLAAKASPHLSWRRTTVGLLSVVGAFIAVVGMFMLLRMLGIGPSGSLLAAGRLEARAPVIIADFRTSRADTSVGSVVAEAVRANLAQSASITLVPATTVAATLRRMQVPSAALLTTELARQVAARQGVKAVVDGEVTGLGAGFVVTVRLLTADSGSVLASYQGTIDGPSQLIAGVDALTRKLRGRIGESLRAVQASPPLEQVTTSSIEALRLYSEGVRAHDIEGNYYRAVPLLRRAVAVDSNFAMAWRKLGVALSNLGESSESSDSALTRAYQLRSRLTEQERLFTEAFYYQRGPGADRQRAIAAYQGLLDRGDSTSVLNNLATLYAALRQPERAESLYKLSVRREPALMLAVVNLIESYEQQGKVDSALALAAQTMRRQPRNSLVFTRLVRLLAIKGNEREASRLADSARKTDDITAQAFSTGYLNAMDLRAGKLASVVRRNADPITRKLPAMYGLAPGFAMEMAAVRSWARDDTVRGIRVLDSIQASPGFAAARATPLRLSMISTYAALGRPDRARVLFAQYMATLRDSASRRRASMEVHSSRGAIALAEGRAREAITEFWASDSLPDGPADSDPTPVLASVARALDVAGQSDSAITMFEKYLSTPSLSHYGLDPVLLPRIYVRLGELYETKGNREQALANYMKFVQLWQNADPDLQPKVQEVRRRMARLSDTEPARTR